MEFIKKVKMWREELERQNASMGVKSVFDSMLVYMGEQQREIKRLKAPSIPTKPDVNGNELTK